MSNPENAVAGMPQEQSSMVWDGGIESYQNIVEWMKSLGCTYALAGEVLYKGDAIVWPRASGIEVARPGSRVSAFSRNQDGVMTFAADYGRCLSEIVKAAHRRIAAHAAKGRTAYVTNKHGVCRVAGGIAIPLPPSEVARRLNELESVAFEMQLAQLAMAKAQECDPTPAAAKEAQ